MERDGTKYYKRMLDGKPATYDYLLAAGWADEEDGWADKSDAIAEFSVSNLRKPMKPGASPVQSMIQVPRTQPARTRIADQQPRAPRG